MYDTITSLQMFPLYLSLLSGVMINLFNFIHLTVPFLFSDLAAVFLSSNVTKPLFFVCNLVDLFF